MNDKYCTETKTTPIAIGVEVEKHKDGTYTFKSFKEVDGIKEYQRSNGQPPD